MKCSKSGKFSLNILEKGIKKFLLPSRKKEVKRFGNGNLITAEMTGKFYQRRPW